MPMIALTREMGSLGKYVAAGIAGRTGRKAVRHEIFGPIASKMRPCKNHLERFTTGRTSPSTFTADETVPFPVDDRLTAAGPAGPRYRREG